MFLLLLRLLKLILMQMIIQLNVRMEIFQSNNDYLILIFSTKNKN